MGAGAVGAGQWERRCSHLNALLHLGTELRGRPAWAGLRSAQDCEFPANSQQVQAAAGQEPHFHSKNQKLPRNSGHLLPEPWQQLGRWRPCSPLRK